ncbi:Endonuclease/exonuclease/phosphatase [Chytridium lagenaria]|nr:Endonuclease/exonuclease/phosphatase [Chytridium lagenaria]
MKKFLARLSFINSDSLDSVPTTIRNPNQFKLVTYNVWFDGLLQKERANGLLEILKSELPDVVCLQEITKTFMEVLLTNKWWKANYDVCQKGFDPARCWYGIITLTRKDSMTVVAEELVLFPQTSMGRVLLVVDVQGKPSKNHPGMPLIRIAQSHFESMDTAPIRREQRQIAGHYARLGDKGNHKVGFICGDTNCHGPDEQYPFEEIRFADVWRVLKGEENGPTFGLTFKKGVEPEARLDRIGWQGPTFRPVDVRRIGTECLNGTAGLYPSDHVGLVAIFEHVMN